MSLRRISLRVLLPLLALLALPAAADITNASLEIQGIGLSVVTPEPPVTTAIDVPTTVQTKFGGKMNDEAMAIEGLLAVGDLTGPGLDSPLELSTAPGHRFQIPGLSREGVYTLQNIRLMKGRELLQYATPSAAPIIVADLFKTTVEVRQLSPEEIRARGIVIDARNFEVYEYTLSFIINGQTVKIPFPVIIDPRTRQVQLMPVIDPYTLPPISTIGVGRFTPPDIITVAFEDDKLPEDERNTPKEAKEPGEKLYTRPPIPAAIVIPNSLAVMHQFFAVILTVQNGAPNGSTARLENVSARIKVPSQLRTATSKPAVSLGQAVPLVDKVNGLTILIAQAKAEAEWSVEALKPGTHTIEIELKATLKENGQEDVPLVARPRASVVVHDARFNIAFSHPDVVRKGIEYTTYSFVTNTSPATQTIRLANSVPPCETAGNANACRIGGGLSDEITIPSGETRTVEYRLRSGITGKVFATAASIDSENAIATAQLHMGVSDTGIPLSPATLIMPHYAQYVDESLVSEYLRILGLGYSLATAPVTSATAKLPRVIKSDVYRRAVDIAQAGQAIFLANDAPGSKRDALAALSIDLLGNMAELSQWDALRRQEKYARPAGAAVVRQLEAAGLANSTTFETFVDDFGKALSHRNGYVAALVHGPEVAGNARPYALSVRGVSSGRRMDVPNEVESGWVRDLPYGDLSTISAPDLDRVGELALVGRWTGEDLEVVVTPSVSGVFRIELLYPNTTDGSTMRAHLEMTGVAGEPLRFPLSRGATSVNAVMPNGGFAATAQSSVIALEPLRIVGMRQDLYLDEHGHKVSILFNRPAAAGAVGAVPAVDLRTKFHGEIDFDKDGVVWMNEPRPISAAALQESGRVIDLTFDHVLTTNASYTIEVDALFDPRLNVPASFPGEFVPKIDNDRPAGIIYGKFVRGDNTPLGDHEVILFSGRPNPMTRGAVFEEFENPRRRVPVNPYIEPPQIVNTRTDGSYLFEFVPRDMEADFSGSFRLWGLADGLTKYTFVDGTVRLPGRVHHVTLQLLGRGSAEGTVRYDNGEIAKNANVTVGSTAFEGVRSAVTNDQGFYRVDDLPVGPLAFTATDGSGNIGYAAGEIATPGEIEQQDISIYRQPVPKNGSVQGIVRRSDTNQPVSGATVGVFNNGYPLFNLTTDSDGRYNAEKVPAGFISVVAAEWSISRQSASTDFDLRGDEVRQVDLMLSVQADEQLTTVTGEVLREDPLFPGNASKYQRVAGALVKIDEMRIVTADADGKFEYLNVPLSRSGRTIAAYDPATRRTERAAVPQLTVAGPNHVPILLRGLGKGTIRARLFDARGAAAAGVEMLVKAGGAYYGMADLGGGLYELANLDVGGDYVVRTGGVPAIYGDQEVISGAVRVAFDGQTASVSLRLPGQGNVRARVKGISIPSGGGEPILTPLISDITIRYSIFNASTLTKEIKEVQLSTNQNGLPGDAVFTAIPALRNYTVISNHPLGHSAGNGMLAFEGDLGDHTLLLSNLGHISGTVYAIDGVTPVPNAQVRLEDGHQDQGIVNTGLDGKFEFRNVAPNTGFRVWAESTQAGIYRTGERYGSIASNGGVVNVSVTMLERGQIEGKIVYGAYKVYDPLHPENNVLDNTPSDLSDNAPVPMARFWMRELDFPRRDIGTGQQPLTADLAGRFAIDNVFVGRLRATAWSFDNPDLRGDWTATLTREGELLTPYISIGGGGGTGTIVATVTNPNQQNAPVENAEVQLFRGGLFDLASTGVDGKVRFEQLPVGTYVVGAYSKALGKSGRAPDAIVVSTDQVSEARIMLTFSGEVTGRLTDPEGTPVNAPVPGSHVTISMAEGFQQRFTTTALGEYLVEGVREGLFTLEAKDTTSNRRARASGLLSAADPAPVVNLELERTETLHLGVYLPDDFGGNSGVLAGLVEATVTQRGGEFSRALQGNPIVMPELFLNERYSIHVQELAGERRQLGFAGNFPQGNASAPIKLHYPAYGSAEVLVRRAGAPVEDARVAIRVSRYDTRTVYSDAAGRVFASGLPLNGQYSVTVTTLDGSSGSGTVHVLRTSVTASLTIEVGSRATLTGKVLAEAGGPSIGTPVVINFSGGQLSGTTDDQGSFTFAGVATTPGAAAVELVYYGPDGSTVGARQSFPLGNEWAGREYSVPTVRIDATPPVLLDIVPEQGAGNVPPDTHLKFVYSEPINNATVNNDTFTLQPADGSPRVNASFTFLYGANNTYIVTMVPPAPPAGQDFPLKSNTLYRLTVSQHVRDTTGHPVGTNRGLTFTTADYVEPRVVSTVPATGEPIPEQITYEFRFNEPLDPAPFEPGGNGVFQLSRMSGPEETATVEENVSGDAYVDPFTGITLYFAPSEGTKPNSFYRIKFSGVRDLQGNIVPEQTYRLASFDTFKPFVILNSPVPDGAPLVSGLTYKLLPDIRNATADGAPAIDIDSVEYFRVENEVETFIKAVSKAPFAYDFVAPEAPAAGIPLVFRARAIDLSTNKSDKVTLALTVKPNQPPTVAVALDRTSNVYAGETVNATVTTSDEVIDINLQLDVKATRTDGTEYRIVHPRTVHRNSIADPWPATSIPVALPVNLLGGSTMTFTGIATDMSGLSASSTTPLTLAVDTSKPVIVSTTPVAWTELSFGSSYKLSASVTDVGTGVSQVVFAVDGQTFTIPRSASVNGLFTSPSIVVTANSVNTTMPVTVTAVDHAGNTETQTFNVVYLAVNDPTVPTGEWLCPISSAVLPANISNLPVKLRLRATDDVSVTSVRFQLPGVETLVTPTEELPGEYAATVTINTPGSQTTDYIITAIVKDANPAHTQEYRLRLSFVTPDFTFDATQAIIAADVATYEDKTIVVRGTQGRLVPHVPVRLKNLIVLEGARVDTLATTTSTERRLDLTVTDSLYIDCASSIDVTGRGYLGAYGTNSDGSGTRNESDRGRTIGNVNTTGSIGAGGSHAGFGGLWTGVANSVYGSYTEPRTLGSGGGSSGSTAGAGAGGGAIALSGSAESRFVVAGSIRADGVSGAPLQGGGAGGSVLLQSADIILSRSGRITANGGSVVPGGGGRIAIYTTRTLTAPDNTIQAHGGWNNNGEGPTFADGGAGTVYIVRPGETDGELRVSSFDDAHSTTQHLARPTPVGTAGGPELVFGSIFVGPRSLLRIDSPYRVTKVDGVTVDPTGYLFGPEVQPLLSFVTSPPAGSSVRQNGSIVLTYDAAAADGLASARVILPGRADQVESFSGYPLTVGPRNINLVIPPAAVPGEITARIQITSRSGRAIEQTASFTVTADAAPTVVFDSVNPSTEIYAGGTITASGTGTDDLEVQTLTLLSSVGTVTSQAATKPTPQSMARQFSVALPKSVPSGTNVLLTLNASDGFPGRAAATATHSIAIRRDEVAPVVTIIRPTPNQTINEIANGTFTIEVNATDAEVGVNTVKATFEGTEYTLQPVSGQPGRYSVNVPIPSVEGVTPIAKAIAVSVTDFEPNTTPASQTIFISPLADPNAPKMAWVCSSPNSMYPEGTAVSLRVSAEGSSAQNGVQRVEFIINGAAPIAATSAGTNLYQASFTIPIGTPAGTVYDIRAAAFSTSGNEAALIGTVTVVAGIPVITAREVSPTDLSLDNATVIVRSGGVLTITGPHTFTNLVVLDGGKVIQKHVDPANADVITVNRLFVACGAIIDVTGQGFAFRTTYPGATVSSANAGASHIGRGGQRADPGTTYGSIYRPKESGAGEWYRAPGGGVVRIQAAQVAMDGTIRANGANNTSANEGGAAGGSVWIRTGSIHGGGLIEVNGGNGAASSSSNGGGGAIAIEYTDSQSRVPVLQAKSGNHFNPYGGAGSAYVHGPQSGFGDLTIDNTGRPTDSSTVLPALGIAIVESIPSAGIIALQDPASIAPYFAGHWLQVRAADGSVRGFARIASVVNSKQLALDVAVSVTVQVGDTIRGAYRFDHLTLAVAKVQTADLMFVETTPVLDATSSLITGNLAPPTIDQTKISFTKGVGGPFLVGAAGAVSDPDQPISVSTRNTARTPAAQELLPSGATIGTVGGLSVRKITNGQQWGSARAPRGSNQSAYISCKASQTNNNLDCALLNLEYTRIYTFGIFNNGTWQVWVNNSPTSTTGSYTTNTVFRVERTPGMVRFYVDGTMVRETVPDSAVLYPLVNVRYDGAEVNSIHYSVDTNLSSSGKANADGSFTLPFEAAAGDPITLTARDGHVFPMEATDVSVGSVPADFGVASVTFNPNPATGGRTAVGTVTLLSAAGSGGATVTLRSNHAAAPVPITLTIPAGQLSAPFNVVATAVSAQTDVTITAAWSASAVSTVLSIVKDPNAPTITVTSPVAGAQYNEGSTVQIPVQATVIDEDSGVKRVFATFNSQTYELPRDTAKGANVYFANVPAPFVDGTQPVPYDIIVNATDNTDNTTAAPAVQVFIKPVIDAAMPTISWICSSGSTYPVGTAAKLRVLAKAPNAANPLQKVEFLIDGTTYAATSVATDTYELTWTVPAVASGTTFDITAVATTAAGTNANVVGWITAVVAEQTFSANATIAAADLQYDNKTIVVTGGTLTINGVHTFRHLVVLGGNVTHAAVNSTGDGGLDVRVTGNLYVACNATIDVTGRGFAPNVTWPGVSLPANASGGSHIGWGGQWDLPLGTTFGSVYQPLEPGGGSGNGYGGWGGGIVRMSAANVGVDGVIRANGLTNDAAGAGGSVYLTAGRITGAGRIEATGGSGYYGSGAGGAIAVEYTDAASVVPVMQAASGPTHGHNRLAGAGSMYTKGPQSTYGDLVIDGENRVHQWTGLSALGTGTAGTGSTGATLVTGRPSIARYFLGHWVQILTPAGALKGTWRVAAITGGTITLADSGSTAPNVAEGDKFKGVYRFDKVTFRAVVVSTVDPIITGEQIIEGNVYVNALAATNLTIKGKLLGPANTLTPMTIDVENELRVDTGGEINLTGRGFAPATSYSGAVVAGNATGGSHLGYGGIWDGPFGTTFGSVYRPQEFGAGSTHGGSGGGALRVNAGSVVVHGAIRANGAYSDSAGAGGSIWIKTGRISGAGVIETNGGDGYYGSGGGGAISIEYTDASSQLPVLHSTSGPTHGHNRLGGAGTMYTRGPQSTYGDLVVDGESRVHQWTALPSLGNGTALSGSSGVTLVTARAANIPAYFEGHWVEIYDADGDLEGTWRVATIAGKTVTLAPNASETISVDEGDRWQGVYRFDNVDFRGIVVDSPDPIRVLGTQIIKGTVTTSRIDTTNLTIAAGGTLTHNIGDSLTIDVEGELRIDNGGTIDVTGKGYAPFATYPGAVVPGNGSGASHIGYGGLWDGPYASTYGSVYSPQERGGGSTHYGHGGGIIRIDSGSLVVNGSIRANGQQHEGGGGGGSVWITTGRISGNGGIETNGGTGYFGSGGGGALSIEYTDPTSVIPGTGCASGSTYGHNRLGGPGTQYFKGPNATYGDLLIDGANRMHQATRLPALGKGLALAGSSGNTLVTDRTTNIPAYFAGHWIEIYDPSGTLRGTWRVAAIDQKTVTLAPNAGETISVASGDSWQGIYRFDKFTLRGGVILESDDPIRSNEQIIESTVNLDKIFTNTLRVVGTLSHLAGRTLLIEAANQVHVQGGAVIDVTGRGYTTSTTYPGARLSGNGTGPSHLGRGGVWDSPFGSAYGSVHRPQEYGAAGTHYGAGGGIVRIKTANLTVDGSIRANGQQHETGGAGGSVWITTGRISGAGGIETNGGTGYFGSGGGGAMAIEYTDLSSVVPGTGSAGGSTYGHNRLAGPGTQYYFRPGSTLGDLIVDGANRAHQACELPSLGGGSAMSGSGEGTLVTSLASIPAYFVGHWIEVSTADGSVKGMWRIGAIAGNTITLAPNTNESIPVVAGDTWRGLYRFDNLKIRTSTLTSADSILVTNAIDKDASSSVVVNQGPPQFPAAKRPQIIVESAVTGDAVIGPIGAVTDVDAPIKLSVKNTRTSVVATVNANADGSFRVPVTGIVGDTFTIAATDSHSLPLSSPTYSVNGAIAELNTLASLTIQPSTVTAGTTTYGSLRLNAPARSVGATVALSSSSSAASVPATIVVPGGAVTVQFPITTSSSATEAQITASLGASSVNATLTVTPSSSALVDLVLASSTVEGGTSVNGTVILGAPAPAGGALVMLTSNAPQAGVPATVLIAEGDTQAAFTVTTTKVAATMRAAISATWGSSIAKDLDLTACSAMNVATPASATMNTVWLDEAPPAGATASGDATFDTTQAATGTMALHFAPPTASSIRAWTFTNGAPLTVAPGDRLVFYALVNPCNPPRQMLVQWSDATTQYRASWGENRIGDKSTVMLNAGSVPPGGEWQRIEIVAKTMGITTIKSLTGLTISVDGGEAWIDATGVASCAITKQPKPAYLQNEKVWFDDSLPAGAVPNATYNWDTTQVASGNVADLVGTAADTALTQHYFTAATDSLTLKAEDMIVTYVLIDPCNPPKQLMLQWHDGTAWNRRAYWGENLIDAGALYTVERRRMGSMPETGKWVRLEIPVSSMAMTGMTIRGMAFTLYGGRAWFDRVSVVSRVNLALNKAASQSSGLADPCEMYNCPSKAVDGELTIGYQHTDLQMAPWWQVDLGAVQPIATIDVWNGGFNLCCQDRLQNFWVFVSDVPFTSNTVAGTLAQTGVTSYYYLRQAGRPTSFDVNRIGRYVRVQLAYQNYLHIAEVQVWAPVSPAPVNLAVGRAAAQSSTYANAYVAAMAVNGGSIGESESHTNSESEAWWQVDLGSVQPISSVDIDNVYDPNGAGRMSNFYVFVSDVPFTSNTVAGSLAQAGVSAFYRIGPLSAYKFDPGRTGRYIRIQLTGTNYLHPMEVRVWSPSLSIGALAKTPEKF